MTNQISVYSAARIDCSLPDGCELVVGHVELGQLAGCAYVPRYELGGDHGYQRAIEQNRVNDIARCLGDGQPLDGALIFVVSGCASPVFDRKNKSVKFDDIPGALEILDGQHRFYGAQLYCHGPDADPRQKELPGTSKSVRALAQFYINMPRELAAQKFVEIHTKAKRVTPAVIQEAMRVGFGREHTIEDEIFAELADSFPAVCFTGAESRGRISRDMFRRALAPLFKGPLAKASDAAKKKTVSSYLLQTASDRSTPAKVLAALDVYPVAALAAGSLAASAVAKVVNAVTGERPKTRAKLRAFLRDAITAQGPQMAEGDL